MSVCVVVGEFGQFLIGRQPISGPFWWNAGMFSGHLLQIVSTLRMVRMFFPMGDKSFLYESENFTRDEKLDLLHF